MPRHGREDRSAEEDDGREDHPQVRRGKDPEEVHVEEAEDEAHGQSQPDRSQLLSQPVEENPPEGDLLAHPREDAEEEENLPQGQSFREKILAERLHHLLRDGKEELGGPGYGDARELGGRHPHDDGDPDRRVGSPEGQGLPDIQLVPVDHDEGSTEEDPHQVHQDLCPDTQVAEEPEAVDQEEDPEDSEPAEHPFPEERLSPCELGHVQVSGGDEALPGEEAGGDSSEPRRSAGGRCERQCEKGPVVLSHQNLPHPDADAGQRHGRDHGAEIHPGEGGGEGREEEEEGQGNGVDLILLVAPGVARDGEEHRSHEEDHRKVEEEENGHGFGRKLQGERLRDLDEPQAHVGEEIGQIHHRDHETQRRDGEKLRRDDLSPGRSRGQERLQGPALLLPRDGVRRHQSPSPHHEHHHQGCEDHADDRPPLLPARGQVPGLHGGHPVQVDREPPAPEEILPLRRPQAAQASVHGTIGCAGEVASRPVTQGEEGRRESVGTIVRRKIPANVDHQVHLARLEGRIGRRDGPLLQAVGSGARSLPVDVLEETAGAHGAHAVSSVSISLLRSSGHVRLPTRISSGGCRDPLRGQVGRTAKNLPAPLGSRTRDRVLVDPALQGAVGLLLRHPSENDDQGIEDQRRHHRDEDRPPVAQDLKDLVLEKRAERAP